MHDRFSRNTAELVGEEGIGEVVASDAPIKTRGAPRGLYVN